MISLAPLTEEIRDELAGNGLPFARALPRLQATFPIGTVEDLSRAQRATRSSSAGDRFCRSSRWVFSCWAWCSPAGVCVRSG